MQDMMKMYSMPGMDMGGFGEDGETLILNDNNKLVQYVFETKEGKNIPVICEQLYDLAVLANKPLTPDAMSRFIQRSNEIMLMLAGE